MNAFISVKRFSFCFVRNNSSNKFTPQSFLIVWFKIINKITSLIDFTSLHVQIVTSSEKYGLRFDNSIRTQQIFHVNQTYYEFSNGAFNSIKSATLVNRINLQCMFNCRVRLIISNRVNRIYNAFALGIATVQSTIVSWLLFWLRFQRARSRLGIVL